MIIRTFVVFVILLVSSTAAVWAEPGYPKYPIKTLIEHPTPLEVGALTFRDTEGRTRTLDDFRGQTILVNLWASWCQPCLKEMPSLDRLQAKLGSERFQVVPLSVDRNGSDKAHKFFKKTGITHLPIYMAKSLEATDAFQSRVLPSSFLLDAEGREIARFIGDRDWSADDVIAYLDRHSQPAP